jgi:hypothetical protein
MTGQKTDNIQNTVEKVEFCYAIRTQQIEVIVSRKTNICFQETL